MAPIAHTSYFAIIQCTVHFPSKMPRKSEALNKKRKIGDTIAAYEGINFDSSGSNDETLANNFCSSTPTFDFQNATFLPELEDISSDGGFDYIEDLRPIEMLEHDVKNEDEYTYVDYENSTAEIEDEAQIPLWYGTAMNESCRWSLLDFSAALAASQIVHKIPDTGMNLFCKLISSCLPHGNSAPKNFSDVVKQCLPSDIGQTIIYVCSSKDCSEILGKLFDNCTNPNCPLFGKKQHAYSFIRMQIQPQIESLISNYYFDILRFLSTAVCIPESDSVGDIPTTPAYRALGKNPDGDTLFISLILSSDGTQAFKSNRSSFWPCMAIVAELPPKIRVSIENAVGVGFWVGRDEKVKPDWSLFLPPIISELESLKSGFDLTIAGRNVRIYVKILAMIFDLPAQASVWGVKQFNGKFGCIRCHHPGERVGRLCLWPRLEPAALDKDAQFYKEAWAHLKSCSPNDAYLGVKLISPLAMICNPAQVNIFDSMHLVYRGNAHLIFSRLFNSQPQKWTAIFGKSLISELDSIVQNIRFPHYFNRKIPSLKSISSFKASELKNLLIYALLPITAPFMKQIPDYWHWISVYIHAIRLLSQPSVSIKDTDIAQKLINIWKELLPELCHETSQNFNSHALEHLPDQVKRFGPLWSISTFAFEGFNGYFSRFIMASKGAAEQLGRRFALQQASYKHLAKQVQQQRPFADIVKQLFPRLYQRWAPRLEDTRYQLLDETNLKDTDAISWLKLRFPAVEEANFRFGKRASAGSDVLHSVVHSKKTASIVKYLDSSSDIGENYGEVIIFFSYIGDVFMLVKKFKIVFPTNILDFPEPENELLFSVYDDRLYGSFFYVVEKSHDFENVLLSDILCSAILIETDDALTVTDVLPFEHD